MNWDNDQTLVLINWQQPDIGFKPAEAEPAVKENAFKQDKSIHDKSATSENLFDEYGYGFRMRFLTAYLQRLNNGKNEAWYFFSRLANQEKYDNIRMGDRMLAQEYYSYCKSANVLTGNLNMIQYINYPENNEGL